MSVEALLGTDAVFAADLQALRPHPGQAASAANLRAPARRARPIVASHRGPDCTRVQDAYSLRCAPQVHGAAARHARPRRDGRRPRAGRRHRQPGRARLDGRVESQRQLPRRAGRLRAGLPRDRGRRPRLDRRAPHRPVARRRPLARAAAVPRRRPRRRLRAHDRAVHPGRHRVASSSGSPSRPRVDSIPSSAMQEDHVSMGWSAARKLRRAVDGLTRVLAIELLTAARALDLRAPLRPRPPPPRSSRPARRPVAGPGRDRFLAPEIEAAVDYVAPAPRCAPPRRSPGRWSSAYVRMTKGPQPWTAPARPRPARHRAHRPVLADRGAAAHADEQPRPRGGRTSRRPRRLRRHRPGRPQLGRVRRDRRARSTELREDETLLVQSGKPVGVLRTHEWAPRVLIANSNLVGDWATWPEFRRLEAAGPDHVRPDDRRVVDLHRHPGHPAGHVRDVRRRRGASGSAARSPGTLTVTGGCGGMGGAQPLAVTLNDGVCLVVDVDPARLARRVAHALPGRVADDLDDALRALPGGAGRRGERAVGRPRRQLRRSCCPSCCAAASRSTSSPTRPPRTTRCRYLPDGRRPG